VIIRGVTWLLIRNGRVVLEACPKKARVLGFPNGTWFVPGGKIEDGETATEALEREVKEEWPGVDLDVAKALPIIEGSPVGDVPGHDGYALFLMRPYVIEVRGEIEKTSSEGIPLRYVAIGEALQSPVPQVRMMIGGALDHISHYELYRDAIHAVPPTMAPGLLRAAIEGVVSKRVFQPGGGLRQYINNTLSAMGETPL
jgi:8-oxo-dGTP pyrophosphatase MutT (NUDIX family)